MNPSRREFLASTGTAALGFLLANFHPGLSRILRASETAGSPDQFLVLIRTNGGMDATLGLDPKVFAGNATKGHALRLPNGANEKDMFIEYRASDIIDVQGLHLGPAAAALKEVADSCTIVNGIMMRQDAGHDVLNQYMSSGDGSSRSALLPVELAATRGTGPYGVLFGSSNANSSGGYGVPTGMRTIILSEISAILRALNDTDDFTTLVQGLVKSKTGDTALLQAQRAWAGSREITEKFSAALRELRKNGIKDNVIVPGHVLASAFTLGAASYAVVDLDNQGSSLDTHSDHAGRHIKTQQAVWNRVAGLIKQFKQTSFKQGSLLDATTFMVITEFSRTPALNDSKGKDHNPFTNSVLLAGRGVAGGKTFGASKLIRRALTDDGMPLHTAAPFDYATGKIVNSLTGASFIYPENVVRSVVKIFGDPSGFSSIDLREVKPVPGLAL